MTKQQSSLAQKFEILIKTACIDLNGPGEEEGKMLNYIAAENILSV